MSWFLAYLLAPIPACLFVWGAFYWEPRAAIISYLVSLPMALVAYFLIHRRLPKDPVAQEEELLP